MNRFTHLHVHSHFSLLEALPTIPELVKRAKELEFSAIALTDYGNLYGAMEFYQKAKAQELKPIIGIEIFLADDMHQKRAKIDTHLSHLVLLAENREGYQNLIKIATAAHLEGFYYKPRIDKSFLREHSRGLIALTGCLKGDIPQAIINKDQERTERLAREYLDIFGNQNLFFELQHHPELPWQDVTNNELTTLGEKLNVGIVATNDVHYIAPDDAEANELLLCIKGGRTMEDPGRPTLGGHDWSLRSADDMTAAFTDTPEAIETSQRIAERCNVELELNQWHFPVVQLPEGKTANDVLHEDAVEGLGRLIPNAPEETNARLKYELDIIKQKGYSGYFLVVADFVNWAKQQNISVTTRGSAAGSLVSYCIGITSVNPLDFKLPFERFLNPLRPSAPDIDIDIADDQRDAVIAYVTNKYGQDHVAQICTFGTMLARAAVRDVGRALGYPYAFCDFIAKMVPFGAQGFHVTIDSAMEQNPDLKKRYNEEPQVARLIDLAKKIEGRSRHCSIHAAGVVISPEPLITLVPLQRDPKEEKIITQYEMYSCEAAGLIKMDFLGIRNLSILDLAVKIVSFTKNVSVNLTTIPSNDKKAFDLMAAGNTMGLFQLGGSGMTRYLKELKPASVFDIQAMVALYRPGSMESIPEFIRRKNDPTRVSYPDPRLVEYLEQSYGLLVYQDDILYTAIALAGYDWLEADKLRKAMGKKLKEVMAAEKSKFISGCIKHGGLSTEKASDIWKLIEPFAGYGFNKAHAASYAMVAYQTAYMKANFPAEFMTAVMTCESHDLDKVAEAVAECSAMGIAVLPPDINESRKDFTYISETEIRFGLRAVKNVGEDVIRLIIEERTERGPFASIADFVRRVPHDALNRKAMESMIKAGAFDQLGERMRLLVNLDRFLHFGREQKRIAETGQKTLFVGGGGEDNLHLAESEPVPIQEKLAWEKELLGFYLSSHPLAPFAEELKQHVVPIQTFASGGEGAATIAGIVSGMRIINTKKNERMCFAQVEDQTGSCEVVVFPDTFETTKNLWQEDTILLIRGTGQERDDDMKLLCDGAAVFESGRVPEIIAALPQGKGNDTLKTVFPPGPPVTIVLPDDANPGMLSELKRILSLTPGGSSVFLDLKGKKMKTSVLTNVEPGLIKRIERITGKGTVLIQS